MTSEKDGEDLEWIVERQYQEFYSLQCGDTFVKEGSEPWQAT